jgi:ABC-2 type transport system permease protein
MSLKNTLKCFPALLKVGFAEAVAYRAEMLVWILATTMPFIMLALWSTVAADAPVGRFDQDDFTAYFLITFIVRQLTGAWAAWEINFEVRNGTLAMRLLRPIHPIWAYAAENIAAVPMRLVVSVPVAIVTLLVVGPRHLPNSAALWAIGLVALVGGWLLTFLANIIIGSLSLYIESSLKVMEIWLAVFMVFSGYLIPVELFPGVLRTALDWLPFRYQIGLPVEVLTSAHDVSAALGLLGRQWLFVVVLWGLSLLVWRGGLKRYAAYGG